ncbi:MAG: hypothetical protein MJ247_02285 [Alphaproteobacteria bacterium]|nr:hypothetical protein [Alphaproteobacteria bacterium]
MQKYKKLFVCIGCIVCLGFFGSLAAKGFIKDKLLPSITKQIGQKAGVHVLVGGKYDVVYGITSGFTLTNVRLTGKKEVVFIESITLKFNIFDLVKKIKHLQDLTINNIDILRAKGLYEKHRIGIPELHLKWEEKEDKNQYVWFGRFVFDKERFDMHGSLSSLSEIGDFNIEAKTSKLVFKANGNYNPKKEDINANTNVVVFNVKSLDFSNLELNAKIKGKIREPEISYFELDVLKNEQVIVKAMGDAKIKKPEKANPMLKRLDWIDGRADLSSEYFRQFNLEDLTGVFEAHNGIITLSNVRIGDNLLGAGILKTNEKDMLDAKTSFHLNNFPLSVFKKKGIDSGNISGNIDLSAVAVGYQGLLKTINGKISLAGSNIKYNAKSGPLAKIPGMSTNEIIDVGCLVVNVPVNASVFSSNKQVAAETSNLQIQINGKLDLKTNHMDAMILSEANKVSFASALSEIKLVGPIGNIRIEIDPKKAIERLGIIGKALMTGGKKAVQQVMEKERKLKNVCAIAAGN